MSEIRPQVRSPRETALGRREQIIGAVAACVSEEGIAGVTLRKVAKRAGATTGMLTHYYQSKTALLMDASLAAERALRNRIMDRAGSRPGLDWITAYVEESLRPEQAGELPWSFRLEYWSYVAREDELAEHYASRASRLIGDIERSIEACIENGTFRKGLDTAAAASAVFALTNGLGVDKALQPDGEPGRRLAVFQVLLDGLKARP
jgi:AcrR family transcriptional regulator